MLEKSPEDSETDRAFVLYARLMELAGSRAVPLKLLNKMDQTGELRKIIPLDSKGEKTSLGSIPHQKEPLGSECRPCIFWFKGRCLKGELCLYCHFKHINQRPKRLRASKNTRLRRSRLMGQMQGAENQEGEEDDYSDEFDQEDIGVAKDDVPSKELAALKIDTGTRISL